MIDGDIMATKRLSFKSTLTETDTTPKINLDEAIEHMRIHMKNKVNKNTGRARSSNSTGTIKKRTYNAKRLVIRYAPFEWTDEWINRVRDDIESKSSSGTVCQYLYAIEDLFNANGHPVVLGKPKQISEEKTFHTKEVIFKMIRAAQTNQRDFTLLNTLWFTGARVGEIARINADVDIDFKLGTIRITGYKTNKVRTVPVPRACIRVISEHLQFRREHDMSEKIYPLLFISADDGGILGEHQIYNIVRHYGDLLGIKTYPHLWRHSRCSHLLNVERCPVKLVSKITGHSIKTLLDVYDHTDDEQVRNFINQIEG